MPNAKDLDENTQTRFLLCGYPGSGKTTQLRTLPGKKFMYIFDPNAAQAIRGADVDYEEFLVDVTDLNLSVQTLKAGRGDTPNRARRPEPKTYVEWEADFEQRYAEGFFEAYDWLGFDSFTSFLDIIMDRVMFLNGRLGKQPEQADWSAQMQTCNNVFRVVSQMDLGVLATAHMEMRQDDLTKRIYNQPMLTGRLRVRIPIMFNNVFVCHSEVDDKGKPQYLFQTRPDKEYKTVRCQWNEVAPFEDATIRDFSRAEQYGLGAMLKRFGLTGRPSQRAQRA